MCVGGCEVNIPLVQFQDEFRLINSVHYEQWFNHEIITASFLQNSRTLLYRKHASLNTKWERVVI